MFEFCHIIRFEILTAKREFEYYIGCFDNASDVIAFMRDNIEDGDALRIEITDIGFGYIPSAVRDDASLTIDRDLYLLTVLFENKLR